MKKLKIFLIAFLISSLTFFQAHSFKLDFGADTIKGSDPGKFENEDRFIIPKKKRKDGIYFFAVCDGNRGAEASSYIQKHLEKRFYSYLTPQKDNIAEALKKSILKIENEILYETGFDKDGSTLVVAVLDTTQKRWFTANVGDSRALLTQPLTNTIRFYTKDHSPFENEEEKYRVHNAKGRFCQYFPRSKKKIFLTYDLVGPKTPEQRYLLLPDPYKGGLNISRCIGAKHLKPEYLKIFIANPDVETITQLSGDCLILVSDGLLNTYSNKNVLKILRKNRSLKAQTLAGKLCKLAAKNCPYRHHDDITVVVIKTIPNEPSYDETRPLIRKNRTEREYTPNVHYSSCVEIPYTPQGGYSDDEPPSYPNDNLINIVMEMLENCCL